MYANLLGLICNNFYYKLYLIRRIGKEVLREITETKERMIAEGNSL